MHSNVHFQIKYSMNCAMCLIKLLDSLDTASQAVILQRRCDTPFKWTRVPFLEYPRTMLTITPKAMKASKTSNDTYVGSPPPMKLIYWTGKGPRRALVRVKHQNSPHLSQ